MPEIKNTFTSGKMNQDLDERLVGKDEYRHALNVEVSTSQSGDVGSLQNSFGNTRFSEISDYISNAKCVGSVTDKENDKIYWFIAGDEVDAIAEYDYKTELVVPVLVDASIKETTKIVFGGNESIGQEQAKSLLNITQGSNVVGAEGWGTSTSWSIGNGEAVFTGTQYKPLSDPGFITEIGGHYRVEVSVNHTNANDDGPLVIQLGDKNLPFDGEQINNKSSEHLLYNGTPSVVTEDLGGGWTKNTFHITAASTTGGLVILPGAYYARWQGKIKDLSIKKITYPEFFTFKDHDIGSWVNNANADGPDLSNRAWKVSEGVLTAKEGTQGWVQYKPTVQPFFEFVEGQEYEMTYEITKASSGGDSVFTGGAGNDDFLLAFQSVRSENVRLDPYSTGVKTVRWKQGPTNLDKVSFYHTANTNGDFSVDNISFKKVSRFLSFDASRFITAINVLDGMLFWTDNFSEPKKINIENCKAGTFSVADGDTSTFIGDELLIDGDFSLDGSDWLLDAHCASGSLNNTGNVKLFGGSIVFTGAQNSWAAVMQRDVEISKQEEYEVTFTVSNYEYGKVQPYIVDAVGDVQTGASRSSNGTFTSIIKTPRKGVYRYSPKTAGLRSYNSPNKFKGTVDDFSIKKIQHAWKATTQMKDAFGIFKGDVQEKDITVIKKYPLDPPQMILRGSSKGPNAVINSTCRTPLNTTSSGAHSQHFNSDGDSPYTYLYTRLSHRTSNHQHAAADSDGSNALQLDIGDLWVAKQGHISDGTMVFHDDDSSFKLNDAVDSPWWTQGSIDGFTDNVLGATHNKSDAEREALGLFASPFATESGYLERAWRAWNMVAPWDHCWVTRKNGDEYIGFSSAVRGKDLLGGRVWLSTKVNDYLKGTGDKNKRWNGVGDGTGTYDGTAVTQVEPFHPEAGDTVTFGRWFAPYNNLTFWTYKDGEGNERVKPPGTSRFDTKNPDGTILRDEVGNISSSPTVPIASENYITNPLHFGDGWSGVGKNYVGVAAITNSLSGGLYSKNINQDGYQYVQLVADNLRKHSPYTVSFRVDITQESGSSTTPDFGVSAFDHNGVTVDPVFASTDMRLKNADGIGTYHFSKNLTADATGGLQFFKRNNVECVVSEIQIVSMYANPVQIDMLTFKPRPDYSAGDIIELTNTTKDKKNKAVKIRVRLTEEFTDGHSNFLSLPYHGAGGAPGNWWNEWGYGRTTEGITAPRTWKKGHQGCLSVTNGLNGHQDFCDDSNINNGISNHTTSHYWIITNNYGNSANGLIGDKFSKSSSASSSILQYDGVDAKAQVAGGTGGTYIDSNSTSHSTKIPAGTPAGDLFTTGEYYLLKYELSSTTVTTPTSYIQLFNARPEDWSGNELNNSMIYLPQTPGTHYVTWKQKNYYNERLVIKFSTGWTGAMDNIEWSQIKPDVENWGGAGSNADRKTFDAEIVSIDESIKQLSNIEKMDWTCKLQDKDPLFEKSFPRFSYRWKYQDGEYSAMSPFTQVAFLPGDSYEYDSKKAYNLAMTNHTRKIILHGFQKAPKGAKEIDILFKESHSTNIYTVTTIKGQALQDFEKYEITKEQLHAVVESKQLLRPYDNVPRKALAQEISANRLIYGNYVHQYDVAPQDEPLIQAEVSSSYVPPGSWSPTMKSMRTYQVGVSYLDAYGRQSPVFSGASAVVDVPLLNSPTGNAINAKITNFAPDWATHYKWFVKDSAQSYYNISLDRFYQGEYDDHTWLSFPSSDFNKVQEDDYLILKKQHNKNAPISDLSKKIKYKIIKKQGQSPDFIRSSRDRIGGRITDTTGGGLVFYDSSGYPLVGKTTFKIKASVVEAQGDTGGGNAFKTGLLDSQAGKFIRIGRKNSSGTNSFSNYYEVLHVSRTNTNDSDFLDAEDFYEFTLVKPLGVDATFVGSEYSSSKVLFLEYYGEGFNRFEGDFEGKFFCKILKDSVFDENVIAQQTSTDASFNIVNAVACGYAQLYEGNGIGGYYMGNNTDSDWNKDTSTWLYKRANFDWGYTSNTNVVEGTVTIMTGNSRGQYAGGFIEELFPATFTGTTEFKLGGSSNGENRQLNPYVYVNADSSAITGVGTGGATASATAGHSPSLVKNTDYFDHLFGLFRRSDWRGSYGSDADSNTKAKRGQWFAIDQAFAWGWSKSSLAYPTQGDDESSIIGSGFVRGNSHCSFRFINFGEHDDSGTTAGGSEYFDDFNTWEDSGYEISPMFFDNYDLFKQLSTIGTQFRWSDDPSQTVYTITGTFGAPVTNYMSTSVNNNTLLQTGGVPDNVELANEFLKAAEPENFGYRFQLQLDKDIVWSPTATIPSGQLFNEDGSHTKITSANSSGTGGTSKLEILDHKPSEITYTSESPAVFEVEPRERADLNLYYETSGTNMVLKTGMFVEAINNADVNDGGGSGNYHSIEDIGSIYKPGGSYALPYLYTGGEYQLDTPLSTIFTGPEWFSQANNVLINPYTWSNPASAMPVEFAVDGNFAQQINLSRLQQGAFWSTLALDKYNNQHPDSTSGAKIYGSQAYFYTSTEDSRSRITQQAVFEKYATYRVKFTVSNYQHGKPRLILYSNGKYATTNHSAAMQNGAYEEDIVVTTTGGSYINTILVYNSDSGSLAGEDAFRISDISIKKVFSQPGLNLPKGITLRISKRDDSGYVESYSDYVLPKDLDADLGSAWAEEGQIDLGLIPINWSNCFAFGNGVESNRIQDDYNAKTIDKGPRVSTTLKTSYEEEHRKSGLIYSGIYNGTTGTNKLNEFIQAEKITKDLNPEYGSIQKLFTRNTNVLAFCEDKVLKILSNKDALYNADGNPQLLASNRVLGQSVPFLGEYGISTNPESFANYGYRVYFTDRNRGAVLRLSADGLTTISDKGMKGYFKDKFSLASKAHGNYNEDKDIYNVTIDDETLSFTETVNGWTSFKSFLPEDGISLNGTYFTFKNGDIWKHHVNSVRNSFYNVQHESTVRFVFNDQPALIKDFNTLNFEGTAARVYEQQRGQEDLVTTRGWYADSIVSELQSGSAYKFSKKEGKYFSNISGNKVVGAEIDMKEFTSQGLGFGESIITNNHPTYKPLTIEVVTPSSLPEVALIGATSALYVSSSSSEARTSYIQDIPAGYVYTEDNINESSGWEVISSNAARFDSHFSQNTYSQPMGWYLVDAVKNLVQGNRYFLTMDVEFDKIVDSVGFSGFNVEDYSANSFLQNRMTGTYESYNVPRNSSLPKKTVSTEFTYNRVEFLGSPPIANTTTEGINIFKNPGSAGTISNIQCLNITPAISSQRFVVNTSPTDRTQKINVIERNYIVNQTISVDNKFYIHASTVNGIKQSVQSQDFDALVTTSSSNYTVTLVDLGVTGYYDNVVEINVTLNYNNANGKFPYDGDDLKIQVTGLTNPSIDQ